LELDKPELDSSHFNTQRIQSVLIGVDEEEVGSDNRSRLSFSLASVAIWVVLPPPKRPRNMIKDLKVLIYSSVRENRDA
jgi:hypothetical protein